MEPLKCNLKSSLLIVTHGIQLRIREGASLAQVSVRSQLHIGMLNSHRCHVRMEIPFWILAEILITNYIFIPWKDLD